MLTRLWSSIMGGTQSAPSTMELKHDKHILAYVKRNQAATSKLHQGLQPNASVKQIVEAEGKITLQMNAATQSDVAQVKCSQLVRDFMAGFMTFEESLSSNEIYSAKLILITHRDLLVTSESGKLRITGPKEDVIQALKKIRRLNQPQRKSVQPSCSKNSHQVPSTSSATVTPVLTQQKVDAVHESPVQSSLSNIVNHETDKPKQDQKEAPYEAVDDIITSDHCIVETFKEYVAFAPDQVVARFILYSDHHYQALIKDVEAFATVVIRKHETETKRLVYSYRKLRQIYVHEFSKTCKEKLNHFLKQFASDHKFFNKDHLAKAKVEQPSYFEERPRELNHQLFVKWYENKVVVCGVKEEVHAKIHEIAECIKQLVPRTYNHHFSLEIPDQEIGEFLLNNARHRCMLGEHMQSVGQASVKYKSGRYLMHFTKQQIAKKDIPVFGSTCKDNMDSFLNNYSSCKIDCGEVSPKQISRKCKHLLAGSNNIWVKVMDSMVILVGQRDAVERKRQAIEHQLEDFNIDNHLHTCKEFARLMVTNLQQAKKSPKVFLYNCASRETQILKFVVDTNCQSIHRQLKQFGEVFVDPWAGKILIDLAKDYRGIFSECLTKIGTLFNNYDVSEFNENPHLLHKIHKNDPALFCPRGDKTYKVAASFMQNKVVVIGEMSECKKKEKDIREALSKLLTPNTPSNVTILSEQCTVEETLIYTRCGIERIINSTYGAGSFVVENKKITIKGSEETVEKIKSELHVLDDKLIRKIPEFSHNAKMQYLQKVFNENDATACNLKQTIYNFLLEKNAQGIVVCKEKIYLVANCLKQYSIASNLLDELIKHEPVEVTGISSEIFDLNEWSELEQSTVGIYFIVRDEAVDVTGICEKELKSAVQNLKDFLDDFKPIQTEIPCKEEFAKFYVERVSVEWPQSVKTSFTSCGLKIEGPNKLVQRMERKFRVLASKYKLFEVKKSAPGLSTHIGTNEWENFVSDLEDSKCCKVFVGKNAAEASSTHNIQAPKVSKHKCMYGEIKVKVCQGDITSTLVDAIINGCRSDFCLDWGTVSRAIFEKAGPMIQEECTNNPLYSSECIRITRGWNLMCRHVVHVVTPHSIGPLAERLKEALVYADLMKASSVAIPTIGAGAIGLDIIAVSQAFSKAIELFAESNPVIVKKIKIVVFESAVVHYFQENVIKTKALQLIGKNQLPIAWENLNKIFKPVVMSVCCSGKDKFCEIQALIDSHIEESTVKKTLSNNEFQEFTEHEWIDICRFAEKNLVKVTRQSLSEIMMHGALKSVEKMEHFIMKLLFDFQRAEFMYKNTCTWNWSISSGTARKLPARIGCQIEDAYKSNVDDLQLTLFGFDFKVYAVRGQFVYHQLKGNLLRCDSDIQDLPLNWERMQGKSIHKVNISPTSDEYQQVLKLFEASHPRYSSVTKIERIQNPTLYQKYKIHKKDVQSQLISNNPVERELFHGTTHSVTDKICQLGFNRVFCGKNATVYGKGVYFAKHSKYSVDYCDSSLFGEKQMFLAKVLTGDYCVGDRSYLEPPKKPGAGATHRLYDCVVNDKDNPYIFVVFNDDSAYPTYLITFN